MIKYLERIKDIGARDKLCKRIETFGDELLCSPPEVFRNNVNEMPSKGHVISGSIVL